MATHLLTNANAEISTPTDMNDFTTKYKKTRNTILTTDYITSKKTNTFTSIQDGAYNFIASTENNVTINVDAIKTKLNELKKPENKIENDIKNKIKSIITDLRAHVKKLTENTSDIKNKLAEIYAINSSIKVFTILYMYVVLIDKFLTPAKPVDPTDNIVSKTCKGLFIEGNCTNLFLKLSRTTLVKIKNLISTDNITSNNITTNATEITVIKELDDQYTILINDIKLISMLTAADNIKNIVSLLREAQYYEALSAFNSSGQSDAGDNALLKYVIDSLPILSGFSVEDLDIQA